MVIDIRGAESYVNVKHERRHPLRNCASGDVCAPNALTRDRTFAWHGNGW